jgi:hypothetical protein
LASAGVTRWPHNRLMHTHPIEALVEGALVIIVAIAVVLALRRSACA